MSHPAHYDTERLRRLPIASVAARLGAMLKKVGGRQVTLCPWHDDRHPSLTLYDTDSTPHCHCFACGKGGDVIAYAMQQQGWTFVQACEWLSQTYGIPTGSTPAAIVPAPQRPAAPAPVAYTYIPTEWVDSRVSTDNSLSRCLAQVFDSWLVEQLTEDYRLGCCASRYHDDCVLFPSIDGEGRVHNVKRQHYCTDVTSTAFAHCDRHDIAWMGAELVRQGLLPAGAQFDNSCLFGAHLLRRYPTATVVLVESPKNALVGACACPQRLWVAAGSKGMLRREALQCLKGRRVIVIPDRDAITEWTAAVDALRDLALFSVSALCERLAPEDDATFDIADYVLSQRLLPF